MGLFDFFRKKKGLDYDPINIKVTDLKKNFVLDYDLKSWVVKEVYTYDWGDNYFSKEYKLQSSDDVVFLSVEEDDDIEISVTKKINIRSIDENLPEHIEKQKSPPARIFYNGNTYVKGKESPGYFNDEKKSKDWVELISWDYTVAGSNEIMCLEQWGEREFEAAIGKTIREDNISNILPA